MRPSIGLRFVLLAALLLVPVRGEAASPQEAIDTYVQDVLQVFRQYEGADLKAPEERKTFKQDLSSVASEVFAYDIMVRMSLGRYWSDFDSKQQERMVDLFVQMIENNYFGKLMEYITQNGVGKVSEDLIEITDEIVFSSRKAEVRSVIHYQDKNIPVNYRMLSRSDQKWQVYDIYVENVSLIRNYRSQFEELLTTKSPEEVLDMMQRKVEKNEASDLVESK